MDMEDIFKYAAVDKDGQLCVYSVEPVKKINDELDIWALGIEVEAVEKWDSIDYITIPEHINWKNTLIEL